MPLSSAAHKSGETMYRFRSGDSLSEWMTAEQLKACATSGKLTKQCQIQQSGKETWCAAERVSGLFPEPQPEPPAEEIDHDAARGGAAGNLAHQSRLGESIHHVLGRALLQKVHVIAPDWEDPHDATLAGVMNDGVALEFEESGTVVYIPWIHVRAVAVTSESAHSNSRIKDRRGLTIDVDRIPTAAFFPQ